ncbi:MAG: MAPEG family protein [Myxococcota bacterium]
MTALHWLAASALLTAMFWVPYILERMVSLGIMGALRPVGPDDIARQALWARRARQGHYNAVENLVIFAVLTLVADGLDKGTDPMLLTAAQIYFWARAVHFPAIALGVPFVRTGAFLAGFAAQVMAAVVIFS